MKNLSEKIFARIKLLASSFAKCREIYRRGGYATFKITLTSNGSRLASKRILVTGGSSGIGLAIAAKCVAEGASVLITGRDTNRLCEAHEKIGGPGCHTLEWDVSNTRIMSEKLDLAVRTLGGDIDILVNNAGVLSKDQFPYVTEEIWDSVYATNSRGLFFLTQELCRRWMESGGGKKVLNISSQGAFVGATYPYRMTKWDVAGLTQGLGLKLVGHGIIVNGIAPGIVATGMQSRYSEVKENVYCDANPIGRFAFPEEIAELAVFLMSDVANFIVGQTIVCDGGYSLK